MMMGAKRIPHCLQCKKKNTLMYRGGSNKSLKAEQKLSGSRVVHPFSAWLTGSRRYTRARVQMRQKLKSLAAVISFLHRGIRIRTREHWENDCGIRTPLRRYRSPQKTSRETLEKAKSGCTKVHTSCARTAREHRRSQAWHCSSEIDRSGSIVCKHVPCADELSKRCKFDLHPQFTEHAGLDIPTVNCCLQSNR